MSQAARVERLPLRHSPELALCARPATRPGPLLFFQLGWR